MDLRRLALVTAVSVPLVTFASAKAPDLSHGPQSAEALLYAVTKTAEGKKYYPKHEKVINVPLRTAIRNLSHHMHPCYDARVTTKHGLFGPKSVDEYTSTLRWMNRHEVLFALQKRNLSGNEHYPARIHQPKDGFFVDVATFKATGKHKTTIDLYYRGGFMSSFAAEVYKPIFKWAQDKTAKCVTIDKAI